MIRVLDSTIIYALLYDICIGSIMIYALGLLMIYVLGSIMIHIYIKLDFYVSIHSYVLSQSVCFNRDAATY